MSKRKIDETMTEARNGRAKRKVDEATLPPIVPRAKRSKKNNVAAAAEPVEAKPTKEKAPKVKLPKEDLVVFAFRLRVHERDLIHKAAGAAKASKFVRALTVAAAQGDEKTVLDLLRAVKAGMASAS